MDDKQLTQSVLEIAQALLHCPERVGGPTETGCADIGTLTAEALFFASLFKHTRDRNYANAALDRVDKCVWLASELPMTSALHGGLSGIGWTLAHLDGQLPGVCFDLDEIDEALIDGIVSESHFDLISGTTGIGIYFLERRETLAGKEGLRRVFSHLAGSAERDKHGACWLTPASQILPRFRQSAPYGRYDLGMAHGSAGVIAFLSIAIGCGVLLKEAPELLADASRCLIANRASGEGRSMFGTIRLPDENAAVPVSRAAWCYGDPGIAVALILAARALGSTPLFECGLATAMRAAARTVETSGVKDASLCHGSAGLARIFGVLQSAIRDSRFGECADYWWNDTMGRRSRGQGVGGFQYLEWAEGEVRMIDSRDLLCGAAGIGLATMAAVAPDVDRSWERLLLLDC